MSHVCPINNKPCGCDLNEINPKARAYPCAIASRVGKLIRMMASNNSGDVQNASARLVEMGQPENLFGDLANLIEYATARGILKKYTEDDIEKVRDHTKELVQAEVDGESAQFFDTDGEPLWHSIALFNQRGVAQLRPGWECDFTNDMVAKTMLREPTEKQAKYLLAIFLKLGGSCAASIKARYLHR
jgi:hypothetical protein